MRSQVDFFFHGGYKKYHAILGYGPKKLLASTFDLFDLSISIPGVHCYIVLICFVIGNSSFYFELELY